MAKQERWMPTDHACRECGGRVVQVTNAGPTGGGNPVYRCADCGNSSSGMSTDCICWCGFAHKGQNENPHRCVNVETARKDPVFKLALQQAGYLNETHPERGAKFEVCVITDSGLRRARDIIEKR